MIPVVSSNIEAMGHSDATLTVQFKGGACYTYANVSEETFRSILNADSIGSVFHSKVKSRPDLHPHTKVFV